MSRRNRWGDRRVCYLFSYFKGRPFPPGSKYNSSRKLLLKNNGNVETRNLRQLVCHAHGHGGSRIQTGPSRGGPISVLCCLGLTHGRDLRGCCRPELLHMMVYDPEASSHHGGHRGCSDSFLSSSGSQTQVAQPTRQKPNGLF